jgi:chromosome segregation ATPase
MDRARQATEHSTSATESVIGILRSERHTRLVEAAQRVHSENEVAVLTEERDRLRCQLAEARASREPEAPLSDQIKELQDRHTAELARRQEVLEAEHEQLQTQSEDRQRLNEELDAAHGAIEAGERQRSDLLAELEAAKTERAELVEKHEAEVGRVRAQFEVTVQERQRLQVEAEASRRATHLNVAEQKRLREELEVWRRASEEISAEVARLREAQSTMDAGEVVAERDRLVAERDQLVAERDQLAADLAGDRRALETAMVDREFVDAELAEWRAKAEDEAARSTELEGQLAELRETQGHLEGKISELHARKERLQEQIADLQRARSSGDPDASDLPPTVTGGLALPGDEATRDDLVERLLFAKQQIDGLLQERAQLRVKLRLLGAQTKQN